MEETPDDVAVEEKHQFLTLKEVAKELRFSVDTVRRYFVAGRLKEIEWVDFLGNKKLRATRESVELFKQSKVVETKKQYTKPAPKSRA